MGKTIETGLILRYLIVSQKVKRVLVLAPASVQPQWQEELREKFNLHFWSYSQGKFKDCYGQTSKPALNPWNTQDLVLASSHLVRRTERIEELLAAEPWDLVILDEAHHARRKSPQQRKDTPNRLLQLMQQLRTKTESLILLSATPMQIDPFQSVVGNLQPILAQVPTFIEQAVMSADPEEEGVLLAEFEQVFDTPPLRPGLEEMVAMDVKADLKEIRKPLVPSPVTSERIEALFTDSQILPTQNIFFEFKGDRTWKLTYKDITYLVTFYPEVFDEKPSLRLMSLGEPIFQKLLETIITEQNQLCSTHQQYSHTT